MLPSIAKHAQQYGIKPLKKLGQNFIFDKTLCAKIVKASGLNPGDTVLEIGPGSGGLTRAILDLMPKSLTIVETDRRCIALLQDLQKHYPVLQIIEGDALKFDITGISADKLAIIANLPYNIGTELIIKWLKQAKHISRMTLMLQKEVADRIAALPNTKAYGRLSIICQLTCNIEKRFDVGPQAFYPPPKVHSTVISLEPLENIPSAEITGKIELITKLAFGGRRKMIKSSLKKLHTDIDALLGKLDIDNSLRAENLSPQDYLRLAHLL